MYYVLCNATQQANKQTNLLIPHLDAIVDWWRWVVVAHLMMQSTSKVSKRKGGTLIKPKQIFFLPQSLGIPLCYQHNRD